VNGPDQIRGLDLAYVVGPVVFVMLGGFAFAGYKLTAGKHAEIRRQLDERDAAYDEAAIVESVSGAPGEPLVNRS
jgi:Na+/melibiose symporter-like transporter